LYSHIIDTLFTLCHRVKELLPVPNQKSGNSQNKSVAKLHLELLGTTKKDVDKLLAKYSLGAFKESTSDFWRALRRSQKPTRLERVLQEIDEGKIPWEDSDDDEEMDTGSVPSRNAIAAITSKPHGSKAAGGEAAAAREHEEQEEVAWLTMTAWELRESLAPDASSQDENPEWTDIHQQKHPEVVHFLEQRRTMKEKSRNSKGQQKQQLLPVKREAPRDAVSSPHVCEDAEADNDSDAAVENEAGVNAMPKRRKVDAAATDRDERGPAKSAKPVKSRTNNGASARGGGDKMASLDPSSSSIAVGDTEDEDDEPVLNQATTDTLADSKAISEKDKVRVCIDTCRRTSVFASVSYCSSTARSVVGMHTARCACFVCVHVI